MRLVNIRNVGHRSSALRYFLSCAVALFAVLAVSACARAPQTSAPLSANGGWHEFTGTWIASGSRSTISLGSDRKASISDLNGSLVLAGPSRPGAGFRAEALTLNDTGTGMVGRAVWTDERGDHVYSDLHGEDSATGNKIIGTFLGGTGRYAGAEGTYEFSWRFFIQTDDGNVQGQSAGLNGRIRVVPPHATPDAGGARS